MTLSANSQTSKDSTKLPNSQLRIALKLIEEGKYCSKERDLLQKQNDILYQRLDQKDTTIAIQDRRLAVRDQIESTYEMKGKIYEAENAALIKKNKDEKEAADMALKKSKAKLTTWKIGTVLVAGGAAYLLLK